MFKFKNPLNMISIMLELEHNKKNISRRIWEDDEERKKTIENSHPIQKNGIKHFQLCSFEINIFTAHPASSPAFSEDKAQDEQSEMMCSRAFPSW